MKNTPDHDMHFGPDEDMLAWCKAENITPTKDADGHWDWHAAWAVYTARPDPSDKSDKSDPSDKSDS